MKGITVEQIKKETQEDKTLQKLLNHVRSGKKPITPELQQYQNIFSELSISATGLLIRQHRIVLPQSLHQKAISKAHDMGHLVFILQATLGEMILHLWCCDFYLLFVVL